MRSGKPSLRFIRQFIIPLLLIIPFLLLPSISFAQKPPEIQAIQDKMSRGETLTPEEQKKFDDYLKSLSDKLDKAMDKLKNFKPKAIDLTKPVKLPDDEYLPKQNPAAHYNNAAAPTESEYLALVKKYNAESGAQVADLKAKLDADFAQTKTPNEIANLGMALYAGKTKDHDPTAAAIYALTTSALKSPAGGVFASNLGVLLKNVGAFDDSLKVLLYAEKLLPQSSIVQTNLGWTIAYLGDFFTAKTHFQKAITIDAYDSKPYEGLGLLFRVEGNIPEASKYLRMCLKNGFSSVAAKNLSLVEGKTDALITTNPEGTDADSTPGMRLSDVLVFPYDDAKNQGSTDGKLQFADAPDFFSVTLAGVAAAENKDQFLRYDELKKAEFNTANDALYQSQTEQNPIRPAPIRNGKTVIYPRSYEAEVFALVDLDHIFSRRHLLRAAKMEKHFGNEIHLPIVDKHAAAERTSQSEYRQCARDQPCEEAVSRKTCRAELEIIKPMNGPFQTLWANYVQEERADLKRYYALAAPWLREIKDEKLRAFMNQRREFLIKAADPIEELGVWGPWAVDVHNNWDVCADDPPPPNKGNYLRNKLKVFAEPYGSCHVPVYNFSGGAGFLSASTEATCDSLKVEFGAFGIVASAERRFGDKESDDVTTFRIGTGVKEGFTAKIGDVEMGNAEVGAKGGFFVSMQNGSVIDHGVSGSAKAEATVGNGGEGPLEGHLPTVTLGLSGKTQISAESGPQLSFTDEPSVDFGGIAENLQ